jgi:TolB-like protein
MMTRMRLMAVLAMGGLMAVGSSLSAQDTRPTVAVLYFDNNSIGADRADYDGIGKGLADLLITEMAANSSVRVIERERIQKLLEEQNLVRSGSIDPQTAVQLGKLLGVRHMVTGGFMSDGRGTMVLTARSIEVETGVITNPQRVQAKTDDVLGLIAQLTTRLNNDLRLPPIERRVGMADPAPAQAGKEAAGHAGHGVSPQAEPKADSVRATETRVTDRPAADRPAADRPAQPQQRQPGRTQPAAGRAPQAQPAKLDVRTALLYSKALDAEDTGDKTKAVELYRAVLDKFPDMPQAQQNLRRLQGA